MLHYAGGPSHPALRMLLLHDDDEREVPRHLGCREERSNKPRRRAWTVVSVKNDWSTVFADLSA